MNTNYAAGKKAGVNMKTLTAAEITAMFVLVGWLGAIRPRAVLAWAWPSGKRT
jgi:hypothetical protein